MQRLYLLLLLLLGQLANVITTIWMLLAIIFSPGTNRALRIAIAYDQLLNAATGGSEDETISSRAGKLLPTTKWACVLCKFLDFFQKDHCKNSIGI